MDLNSIDPLDTGQRNRRKRLKRRIKKLWRRVLKSLRAFRNRRVLLVVLWVVNTIVQLARLIGQVIDGS